MAGSFRDLSPILRGLAALILIAALAPFARAGLFASPVARASSLAAAAAPVFPGPVLGAANISTPAPANFAVTCNVHPNSDPGKAAGKTLAPGTAIFDLGGCGQALLYLNDPASGKFQASLAVSDAATGTSTVLRLFLLAPGGALLRTMDFKATKGVAQAVDFDVSGGVTLALIFPNPTDSYIYDIKLTGKARALAATPLTHHGLPVGGTAVPASAVHFDCNAFVSSQANTVSTLEISATGSLQMLGCGKITVQIPPSATGALALRYGLSDSTNYSSLPTQVSLRALDGSGHLLRKAIGMTYLGNGLQPIWINLAGSKSVTFTMDGGNTDVQAVVAGLSFLPAAVTPHHNPDHQDFGSPSGAPIPVAPDSVVGLCNANLGNSDVTVAKQLVPRYTYMAVDGCGTAELIMTNAHGRFTARIGVSDASGVKTIAAHLVVYDQNSKPLSNLSVTARQGQPGTAIGASITGASIVQITFTGSASGILYDMRLSGHATLYDRVFPPSEPPVSTTGGTVVDPRMASVTCNVAVTTQDFALIHQVALEQWSLYLNGCGSATLNIASLPGPHKMFSALYGIALQDPTVLIAHLQLAVLDAKGKTIRQATFVARAGYGPRRAAISLAGGAKLQITPNGQLVAFALTTF
jgi:hypothetical protein